LIPLPEISPEYLCASLIQFGPQPCNLTVVLADEVSHEHIQLHRPANTLARFNMQYSFMEKILVVMVNR
jgi:hypothetical protein